jgi:3-methyladenine DNA glycosylase AlkC
MKNLFNTELISVAARNISTNFSEFDQAGFIQVASDNIENRELKDRANQIYVALKTHLPNDYLTSLSILLNTLSPVQDNQNLTEITTDENGVAGWMIMPFTQYVGELGQDHLVESMDALKLMTKRFTSEFGIRYLLLQHPEKCLKIMQSWCEDKCHHVRRLVSEGTRPLLPWAMQLPNFKNDPTPVLPLLEKLKSDPSEYVRRSVANHLNDIAKNQPDLVADIAKRWLADTECRVDKKAHKEACENRQRLVKHACRTLIKQGHEKTLLAFGYNKPEDILVDITLSKTLVNMGDSFTITVTLNNQSNTQCNKQSNKQKSKPQPLLMDYVIYHQKANGTLTPKVFKWKELVIKAGETITLTKNHSIKEISTRKYYAGEHKCSVMLNGQELAITTFSLTMAND